MKWVGLSVNLWGIIIMIDLIVRMTIYHQISWRKSAYIKIAQIELSLGAI